MGDAQELFFGCPRFHLWMPKSLSRGCPRVKKNLGEPRRCWVCEGGGFKAFRFRKEGRAEGCVRVSANPPFLRFARTALRAKGEGWSGTWVGWGQAPKPPDFDGVQAPTRPALSAPVAPVATDHQREANVRAFTPRTKQGANTRPGSCAQILLSFTGGMTHTPRRAQ